MIIALFNNFFVIVLTLVCVMKVSYPALFFIAAGVMMIFITAEEMDINMTAAKLAAAVCFSFTGGFFPAFLIFAAPDKQGSVKRSITGALFYLAYFVASVIYDGDGLSGREIAVFIIRLVFVFVMILLISYLKS